jgi:tetratricopeptide (TPR) repeat protein
VSAPPGALVLLCHRDPPGTRHPPLAQLLGHSGVQGLTTRLPLRALERSELRALVEHHVAGRAPVSDIFVDRLWERTGGNPLFATELLRQVDDAALDEGRLDDALPDGVRDLVRHRWLSLGEATRETVAAAAVLHRDAEFGRLCRLVDLPEDHVVAALDEASGQGFLVQGGQSWSTDYTFPHELMREAVYTEIPLPRRQRLHRRAVEAILAAPTTDADVIAAAVHACDAGPATDPRETAELVERAVRLAAASFGYEEAVRLAEAGLDLLRRFATPRRQADAAVAVARLRLQSGRGYDRATELLEEALATYLSLGDTEAAGRAHSRLGTVLSVPRQGMDVTRSLEHFAAAERLLVEPAAAFPLHRGRMSAAMHALDHVALGEAADRCAELADQAGRPTLAAAAGWGRGWRALDLGRPDDALGLLEEAWSSVRDLGDPLLGWPAANAAAMICTVYLLDPRTGRAWCRRGLGHPRFDALAHPHDALVDQLVLALAEAGEIDAAVQTVNALPEAAVGRRLVRFLQGEWEQAAEEWRAALDRDLAVGDMHDAVASARWLADALLALDKEPDARQVLQLVLDISEAAPQVPSEVWSRSRLASLAGTPYAEADGHLARCLVLMDPGQDWRGLVGEVALATAAVALRRQDTAHAASAASEATSVFSTYRLPWRRTAALRLRSDIARRAGDHDRADSLALEASTVLDGMGAHPRWHRSPHLNTTSTPRLHG